MREGSIEFRVRYAECDPMGVAHHSAFAPWLEMGRTELLRSQGGCYRDLEAAGYLLAVTRLEIRYLRPARYDDVLRLQTTLERTTHVRIDHSYRLLRGDEVLATAQTTLASLGRDGKPRALPDALVGEPD